jgi:hypothetical protein
MAADELTGYACGLASALAWLIPLFAVGLLTPLDRRRRSRESLGKYGRGERAFGLSLDAGLRYVLLLGVTAGVAGELGLALWGPDLLHRYGGSLALAFVPALVTLWALCWFARLVTGGRWPVTGGGRKLLAFLAIILFSVALSLPTLLLARGHKEPTAPAELTSTLVMYTGIASAVNLTDTKWASPLMQSVTRRVPAPLLTTFWYLILGLVFWGFGRRSTRPLPPLTAPPPPPAASDLSPGPDTSPVAPPSAG